MNENLLATIDQVYEDGVSLIFAGSSVPSQKHYHTNGAISFQAGQRVKCCRISGTVLVEYPIGGGGPPVGPFPITQQNVDQYFTCYWNDQSPGWGISGDILSPKNIGVDGTTAQAYLVAKQNVKITVSLKATTESNFDKVWLAYQNSMGTYVYIANDISGDIDSTYGPYLLDEGKRIDFRYSKDNSQSAPGEKVEVKITAELL